MADVLIPSQLAEACRAYHDAVMDMQADLPIRKARQKVMDAHKLVQQADNDLARAEEPYRKRMAEIKPYIEANAMEVGASFDHGGVKVKYVKGHTRISIPKKELVSIEKHDPELWAQLEPHRVVKVIPPTAKVVE